jgi:hypothetical protein
LRMHHFVVLFIGWVAFFPSGSWPSVNQHSTTVNFFWLLTFGLLYFSWLFFFNPNFHTTLPPSYPTNLAILLT